MLLTAPVIFVSAAIFVANTIARNADANGRKLQGDLSCLGSVAGLLKRLLLALAIVGSALVAKFFVMTLAGLQDDAHIVNILKFKLSGFSTKYEDFQVMSWLCFQPISLAVIVVVGHPITDLLCPNFFGQTLLYVCSGAYQIMQWHDFDFLQGAEALPFRGLAMLVAVAVVGLLEIRRRNPQMRAIDSALVFSAANGILLAGLFCLIQRLSSVGVPFLCIFISQAASPDHMMSVLGAVWPVRRETATNLEFSKLGGVPKQPHYARKQKKNAPTQNQREAGTTHTSVSHFKANDSNEPKLRLVLRLALFCFGLGLAAICGLQAVSSLETAVQTAQSKAGPVNGPMITSDMVVSILCCLRFKFLVHDL